MAKEQLQLLWRLQMRERRLEERAVVALFLGEAGKLVVVALFLNEAVVMHFFWIKRGSRG